MTDDFSSRPAPKRVRSEKDHSKADTKQDEDDRKGEGKDGKDGEHEDEDWLSKAPFSVGASWDGWTTKWRESCWCGKSESSIRYRCMDERHSRDVEEFC